MHLLASHSGLTVCRVRVPVGLSVSARRTVYRTSSLYTHLSGFHGREFEDTCVITHAQSSTISWHTLSHARDVDYCYSATTAYTCAHMHMRAHLRSCVTYAHADTFMQVRVLQAISQQGDEIPCHAGEQGRDAQVSSCMCKAVVIRVPVSVCVHKRHCMPGCNTLRICVVHN